jgi:hypothetical protein
MDIDIRPITPDRAISSAASWRPPSARPSPRRSWPTTTGWFEYDRSIGAFDGDRIVGTGGAYSMDLTLPGLTTIPIGGLTAISVLPTHRRRGILRSMIAYHFEETEGRGELVSALGASESVIYGRFGYGLATSFADYEIDPRRASSPGRPAAGRVRLLEPEETAKIVPPLYDRYRRGQPGELSRPQAWWDVLRPRPRVDPAGGEPPLRRGLRVRPGPGRRLGQLPGREPLAQTAWPPTSSRCGCWSG